MRLNSHDETIKRNYIQKYRFLIGEYEQVKRKEHPKYKFVQEFYEATDTDRRSFLKYYHRFKQSGKESDLLPRKRGPKWKSRRPIPFIEHKVLSLRQKGLNRYEIVHMLKPQLKAHTPSPSGVYNIIKRHGVNRLSPVMKENKRQIIKTKAGELGHIDTHYLSKCLIHTESKTRYLVMVEDIKSLTVMIAVLKCFNILADHYDIRFKEVLTDNGPEFGVKHSTKKAGHPFERMLIELGIKHRYTRPYRPQTNGKAERFWRTIEDDLLRETTFDSLAELREELLQYLYYYNHERPHQGLGGLTPLAFNKTCPRIT
jgi:transposase InsO family protein